MRKNIRQIKQELRNFAYDPSADYWARKDKEFKKRDVTTYNTFVRRLVNDLRRGSLAFDLYIGWNNANTDDITEDDLFTIIGDRGLIENLADILCRQKVVGLDVSEISGNLYDDLHDLQQLDSYYWTQMSPVSIDNYSVLVRKTIRDFNAGLRAYARLEKSRGCRINDDFEDGLDINIEDHALLRLYLAVQFGDYDTSHCKYSH